MTYPGVVSFAMSRSLILDLNSIADHEEIDKITVKRTKEKAQNEFRFIRAPAYHIKESAYSKRHLYQFRVSYKDTRRSKILSFSLAMIL